MHLKVDPARVDCDKITGIPVRSELNGRWGANDIAELTKESLLEWLRSRPNFAEQTVLILLGHPRDDEAGPVVVKVGLVPKDENKLYTQKQFMAAVLYELNVWCNEEPRLSDQRARTIDEWMTNFGQYLSF